MSRDVSLFLMRMLGWVSTICCILLLASFAVFVVNQSSAATRSQVQSLTTGTAEAATHKSGSATAHKSTLHRLVDEAGEALRAPFAGVESSSHSEWVKVGIGTLLALLFYGVVLRFFVRSLGTRARSLAQ